MGANKITWEQFAVCSNEAQSINHRFEDLSRQLFVYEFLNGKKEHRYLHSNPNNPGIESEPVYDEINNKWIGYQAKFFEHKVSYEQLQHSATKTVEHYKGRVDLVYIFCNKPITSTSKSFIRIESIFHDANINVKLITDSAILDLVRKYPNLARYYFEQHSFDQMWFNMHTQDVVAKLGDRYNACFNVDTQPSLAVSLFVHDSDAVGYLNKKKETLLNAVESLDWRYDGFAEFKKELKSAVLKIPDITGEDITACLQWDDMIQKAIGQNLRKFESSIEKLNNELEVLALDSKETEAHRRRKQTHEILEKIKLFEKLRSIANGLKLTKREETLIQSNILVLEGKAGVGKSHLLANETQKFLSCDQWALLLLGGDYFGTTPIPEQICSELGVKCSFNEMLEILNTEGEKSNYIVPVFIDALNETWHLDLWKCYLPKLFNHIRDLRHLRLVISFRTEYREALIEATGLAAPGVIQIEHSGFAEESFEATKRFLDYYNIPFTPVHMFNQAITNPLFLTLYCKTYQGDDIDLPLLYDRLLSVANKNIHKAMRNALHNLGYDSSMDITTPVIMSLAEFINSTGKRQFSKNELCTLNVWHENGITAPAFVQYIVRENILHSHKNIEGEVFSFAYDQMNDYYCAKQIISQFHSKKELYQYIISDILGVQGGELTAYQNVVLFTYVCALYSNTYSEECIEIVDYIENTLDRNGVFNAYVASFEWRSPNNITLSWFMNLCKKYSPDPENVWNVFIVNSLKKGSCFNADGLHTVLNNYSLNQRDSMWTIYINGMNCRSEHRLVQVIQMYSEGKGLAFTDSGQVELLLTLFGWILTSSNRWLRDTTSKAMVEILKHNFSMAEGLLRKFQSVNDPYVVQRMFGVVWGACVKNKHIDKATFQSLANYVYEEIFSAKTVYPDILLRDYARLIVERYIYENPGDNNFEISVLMPPYASDPIPQIEDQGYLDKDCGKGLWNLIHSMRFQESGWYGDFGRYVYEAALNDFDVDHSLVFNYSVYYIINHLGYKNELFGEYDAFLQSFNYDRHNTGKVERIGKKYQWIAMYHILARVADHCTKKHQIFSDIEQQDYCGPWDPYVRDFDPSLSQHFMYTGDLPVFLKQANSEQNITSETEVPLLSAKDELAWLRKYPPFFEAQRQQMILKDSNETVWVVLSRYANTRQSTQDKLQIWNWLYGYFVTNDQYTALMKYADKEFDLLTGDISNVPETYRIFCREYPWAQSCTDLRHYTSTPLKIKTGEKQTIFQMQPKLEYRYTDDSSEENDPKIQEANSGEQQGSVTSNLEISITEETVLTEVDIEDDLGYMISASVNIVWEEEFDASKNETLSWYAPCAEIIDDLKLRYGECDGAFYDENGRLAAFDTSVTGEKVGIVVRQDLLDKFLEERGLRLVWFVKAAKEIHGHDNRIQRYTDWGGLWLYENDTATGKMYIVSQFDGFETD